MDSRELHTEFRWGNPKERGHLASTGVDGRIRVKQFLNEQDRMGYVTVILIGIGTSGGLL
jgi:hypothetical protein